MISFPRGTGMFRFPRLSPSALSGDLTAPPSHVGAYLAIGRFPDSGTRGSKDVCSSPRIFAACHALHRLLVPRHPPYTLHSLLILLDPASRQRPPGPRPAAVLFLYKSLFFPSPNAVFLHCVLLPRCDRFLLDHSCKMCVCAGARPFRTGADA